MVRKGGAGTKPVPPVPVPALPPPPPPPPRSLSSGLACSVAAGTGLPVGAPTATGWVNDDVRPRLCFVASSTCCDEDLPGATAARSPLSGPPGVPSERRTTRASAAASVAAMASRRRDLLRGAISIRLEAGLTVGARKLRTRASRIARPNVARAKRASFRSWGDNPISGRRIRPAARAADFRSDRDNASPSATRRARLGRRPKR